MTIGRNGVFKPYEELGFSDDFMFGRVMQDKALLRDVLECLLQHPVGELMDVEPQREFKYTSDGKPIRLDIYTRDSGKVYDAEMQNLNHKSIESLELPKRSRFYQSMIDTDHLHKTGRYKNLPESAIMFICTFDPFDMGKGIYTFKEICEEDRNLRLDDGTAKIFYNCTYKGKDLSDDLKSFYEFVDSGEAGSTLTEKLERAVQEARKVEKWRSEYMKEMVLLMDAEDEGIAKERINTEREARRADEAEAELEKARTELEKYKAKFGSIA